MITQESLNNTIAKASAYTFGGLPPLEMNDGVIAKYDDLSWFDKKAIYEFVVNVKLSNAISSGDGVSDIVDYLKKHAVTFLPSGRRFEIGGSLPHNFGRHEQMGWLSAPHMHENKGWKDFYDPIPPLENKTFYIFGRFTV